MYIGGVHSSHSTSDITEHIQNMGIVIKHQVQVLSRKDSWCSFRVGVSADDVSTISCTYSLALECGPFVRSVNQEMPQTGPIPDPTQCMITDNPVEPTDTISTTDNTSHHVSLPQVPTTENDTMTPRPPRVNSGETAHVQAGERPAETQTITHTHTIDLKLRSFNAKGFKQSYEYILDMLCNTDILCISETWIRSHKINLIHNIVDNIFPGMFIVCNKCGMSEVDSN